jgi:dihydrofolate reductase
MKLTVHTFLTLDGVMQGPGGVDEDPGNGFRHGGWMVPHADDDQVRITSTWFGQADEILLGRSTYDMMRSYWSRVTDPGNPIATALNTLPKHVVSTTLTDPTWPNTNVISSDVLAAVSALKDTPGRELQVHGSCQLARTLHDAGLVDEYRLLVFPIVLGSGKRLFPDGASTSAYTLVDSEITRAGAVYQVLRPTSFGVGGFSVEDGKLAIRQPRPGSAEIF